MPVTFVETMIGRDLRLESLRLRVRAEPDADDALPGEIETGIVRLRGEPYLVSGGTFSALGRAEGGRRLTYRLEAGPYIVAGIKTVTGEGAPLSWWRETSQMDVTVTRDGTVEHEGRVELSAGAFARQLLTFRGPPLEIAAYGWRFLSRLVNPG